MDYLNSIVPEVHYYVCAHHNEVLDLNNPDEFGAFLASIQHHGFPTPLLDWTLSPYIAAFFAFRNINDEEPQSDHVQIYVFDASEWIIDYEQILNLRERTKDYVSVIRPLAKYNPRLIAQCGSYTITNVNNMEDHLLNLGQQKNKKFLYILDLSVNEKPKVMKDLSLMGINEMTLFPGMDGVCRFLKEKFFSKNTVGLGPSGRALVKEIMKTRPTINYFDLHSIDDKKRGLINESLLKTARESMKNDILLRNISEHDTKQSIELKDKKQS
ncbi:MAG: FRG domain-containing protein [Candidatus Scalindua sp.]|nr:FRG domain-containing protein [Candidatus Scalindua sp.]